MKRRILGIAVVIMLISLGGCDDKTIRDLDVAEGKVAGTDWKFAKGNAIYGISEYTITLMSDQVTATNICGVFRPSSPHVKFTIPASPGTYQMGDLVADKAVKFYKDYTTSLTAASGYIQIISISAFTIDGIIQASLDDDNDIIGAFYVQTCN